MGRRIRLAAGSAGVVGVWVTMGAIGEFVVGIHHGAWWMTWGLLAWWLCDLAHQWITGERIFHD